MMKSVATDGIIAHWRAIVVTVLFVASGTIGAQEMAPAQYLRTVREAESHFSAGEWKSASDAYGRAVAANPHVAGTWFRLGLARLNSSDAQGAVIALEKALELGADQPRRVMIAIARAHAAAGDNSPHVPRLPRETRSRDGGDPVTPRERT
ncbi:MAG: hypothetical protein H0U13_13610, partial [Gemmatimonadaceae bacterium]|nr:hypothetical protein [Gemmatimonadaceae bacterium]